MRASLPAPLPPQATVDQKLWPGAFAAGWRIREAYLNSRRYGNWRYVTPWGEHHKTRAEAAEAHALEEAGMAPPRAYPRVRLVLSRGGAPNPDGSDRLAPRIARPPSSAARSPAIKRDLEDAAEAQSP